MTERGGASLVSKVTAFTLRERTSGREIKVGSLGQADALKKKMATESDILAWRITWTEKPGSLQSMGSHRVEHN